MNPLERKRLCLSLVLWVGLGSRAMAADLFKPRDLFELPFGNDRGQLGTRVEAGQLLIPRDFSVDSAGRFYIDDRAHHRVIRFSPVGAYEVGFEYPATAQQVFAHADDLQNLWLLIADPVRGIYCGVYDPRGKQLRSALFGQYNKFKLHIRDDGSLRVLLTLRKDPSQTHVYRFDPESHLLKKENVATPPEDHHEFRRANDVFFVDRVPGTAKDGTTPVQRISDAKRNVSAQIEGTVLHIRDSGEIYTRVGAREIRVYGMDGRLRGSTTLTGLSTAAIRFDSAGNFYQLDGIPDVRAEDVPAKDPADRRDAEDRRYTSAMPGLRMRVWVRAD